MWNFLLTTPTGELVGELTNARERSLQLGLSRTSLANFRQNWEDPLSEDLLRGAETLLQVYDDEKVLRFHGRPVSLEATADGDEKLLAATFAGPTWNWQYRVVGRSANASTASGTRAAIAKTLIDAANAEGTTRARTTATSAGSTVTNFNYGPYESLWEAVRRSAEGLDGYDWIETPEPWNDGYIAHWTTADLLGAEQPDTVFEYAGGRSNVQQLTWNRDWSTMANQLWHLADGGIDAPGSNGATLTASDSASAVSYGLFQAVVEAQGIVTAELRNQLLQDHLRVRAEPREVYTFTPDIADPGRPGRVPVFNTDYTIGDLVVLRCQEGPLFDGYVRVYAVTINIDDAGTASVTPVTVPEGS
jgi:hypothetical protein